ncbi:MAG: tungstate ABC transporter substrate-binding protein WtpA [Chloroflexota bacterium]|nr:tungstate ABC transporter substrate-binding protein WtpA [Chloroflexota bacterium]
MKRMILSASAMLVTLIVAACATAPATAPSTPAAPKITLTIFGAGTLAAPFKQVDDAFMQEYPNVTIQAQFGGSVKMVKQVTDLHQVADVVAVADYNVIPKYLFGAGGATAYTTWYAGFATNAITFVYTDKSKFASEITPQNWFEMLARPGVQIGRSNPDTDPSGYQTVQMLNLAEKYYSQPGLAAAILANAPRTNMRDTETELIAALQSGQIDYLAIYLSDARQHGFKYLQLPPQIDLSDAKYSAVYAQASVQTANGALTGAPIVYAVTRPNNAAQPDWALKYLQFLLGADGQSVMKDNGFGTLAPAYANDVAKVPADLKSLVTAWPSQ